MSLSTLPYKYDESNYKQKQHSWSICKLKNLIKIEKKVKINEPGQFTPCVTTITMLINTK